MLITSNSLEHDNTIIKNHVCINTHGKLSIYEKKTTWKGIKLNVKLFATQSPLHKVLKQMGKKKFWFEIKHLWLQCTIRKRIYDLGKKWYKSIFWSA